ncbi:GNAT family N-acetyltransferase [Actinophytocola sp. KF-1]
MAAAGGTVDYPDTPATAADRPPGNGLARRAIGLVAEWGLGTFTRIEAWVEPVNEASRRVLRTNGCRREGLPRSFLVLGSRRADALVYSRIRG